MCTSSADKWFTRGTTEMNLKELEHEARNSLPDSWRWENAKIWNSCKFELQWDPDGCLTSGPKDSLVKSWKELNKLNIFVCKCCSYAAGKLLVLQFVTETFSLRRKSYLRKNPSELLRKESFRRQLHKMKKRSHSNSYIGWNDLKRLHKNHMKKRVLFIEEIKRENWTRELLFFSNFVTFLYKQEDKFCLKFSGIALWITMWIAIWTAMEITMWIAVGINLHP